MTFRHGVYSFELPTALIGMIQTDAALPYVVGTAPVHTVAGTPSVNKLEIVTSWADVEAKFGNVKDFGRYTLMEFLYSQFKIFGFGPVLVVNEFDPATVAGAETATAVALANNTGTLAVAGALVVEVSADAEGTTVYEEGTDYSLAYDENGYPVVTRIADGTIPTASSTVYVNHKVIPADKAGISAEAIVTGLGLIDSSFSTYGKVPALICSPGYSQDPVVMAAMVAKTEYGGGWFAYAMADIDASATGADAVDEVASWKSTNGYLNANLGVFWPKVKIGDDVYHMSTIMAGLYAGVAHDNADVPFETGSNKNLPISGAVVDAGTAVYLTDAQANDLLNAFGITTAINQGPRGWVSWGNLTSIYPASSDPKDMWINYRFMLNWGKNYTRLTLMQKVDAPGNPRQIESIINSLNMDLNSLTGIGAVIGQAKVEFLRENNPATDLIAGKYDFSISIAYPTPMQEIQEIWSIDPSQFGALFSGVVS